MKLGMLPLPPRRRGKQALFVAKESANPGGTDRRSYELAFEARLYGPACIQFLANVMAGQIEGATASDRIKAADMLLTRGFGRPVQPVTFGQNPDGELVNAVPRIIIEHVRPTPPPAADLPRQDP